jgi:hypothetical protein
MSRSLLVSTCRVTRHGSDINNSSVVLSRVAAVCKAVAERVAAPGVAQQRTAALSTRLTGTLGSAAMCALELATTHTLIYYTFI